MLVDKLLEYLGRNPAAYPIVQDRWIAVIAELFVRSFILFPILFGLLPLVYLFIKRKQYKNNRKKLIKKAILYSLGGAVFGCFVLYLIIGALASLAAYSLYGGTI